MPNELQKRRIGLAGANGFIGSAILRQLLRAGISPRTLCGPGLISAIDMQSHVCDLTDAQRVKAWVDGLDVVIHAAGPSSVRKSFETPDEYLRVHVQGTTTLLESCRAAQVKQIVYLSSAEVYGRAEANPVSENHPLQPRSPYAAAKISAEKMIEVYARSFGLHAVVLRPFSIYGPRPAPESLFGTILSMSKQGCIRLHDLRPVRDYCYVDDLAAAILQACSLPKEKITVLNIGTGRGTSVSDFAQCVLHALGMNLPIIEDRSRSRNESEIFDLVADSSRARIVLGWTAKINLEEGLQLAIEASGNIA
jgi:nucleoside-diphosphate-sugar epimerase